MKKNVNNTIDRWIINCKIDKKQVRTLNIRPDIRYPAFLVSGTSLVYCVISQSAQREKTVNYYEHWALHVSVCLYESCTMCKYQYLIENFLIPPSYPKTYFSSCILSRENDDTRQYSILKYVNLIKISFGIELYQKMRIHCLCHKRFIEIVIPIFSQGIQ